MNSKVCTKCQVEKPFDAFGPEKRGKNGLNSKCKECVNTYFRTRKTYQKQYRSNHLKQEKLAINKYQSKMTPGVYRIWTKEGDYIGESKKIERRVGNHKEWNTRSPINSKIIKWEVLEVIEDSFTRKQREAYYINKFKPTLNSLLIEDFPKR